jgi:CxxC-x17-CxxC domain-containing protein
MNIAGLAAKKADSAQKRIFLFISEKINNDREHNQLTGILMGAKKGGSMAFQGGYDQGPREMHKAVCSECKKECEVPFKPRGDRPIYCKECYSKRKSSGR